MEVWEEGDYIPIGKREIIYLSGRGRLYTYREEGDYIPIGKREIIYLSGRGRLHTYQEEGDYISIATLSPPE